MRKVLFFAILIALTSNCIAQRIVAVDPGNSITVNVKPCDEEKNIVATPQREKLPVVNKKTRQPKGISAPVGTQMIPAGGINNSYNKTYNYYHPAQNQRSQETPVVVMRDNRYDGFTLFFWLLLFLVSAGLLLLSFRRLNNNSSTTPADAPTPSDSKPAPIAPTPVIPSYNLEGILATMKKTGGSLTMSPEGGLRFDVPMPSPAKSEDQPVERKESTPNNEQSSSDGSLASKTE